MTIHKGKITFYLKCLCMEKNRGEKREGRKKRGKKKVCEKNAYGKPV